MFILDETISLNDYPFCTDGLQLLTFVCYQHTSVIHGEFNLLFQTESVILLFVIFFFQRFVSSTVCSFNVLTFNVNAFGVVAFDALLCY